MSDSILYAEQLQVELKARFASPEFGQRASYFSGLKRRGLRRGTRPDTVLRHKPEPVYLPW
jgi:hypothetical protein